MQEQTLSAMTPSALRRARLAAGTLALTMGAFGLGAAVLAAPASADATSNSYVIGTPGAAVTGVSVSPTTATSSVAQAYVVTFTAPSAIPNGDTITIGDTTTNNSVTAGSTSVSIVDSNAANCLQSGGNADSAASGTVITLISSCNIAAGDQVKVGLTVTATANFQFVVSTSVNGTAVDSPTVTVSSVPPTISAASQASGTNTVFTISTLGSSLSGEPWTTTTLISGGVDPITNLKLTASGAAGTALSVGWYNGAAGYTVTYTPSGGTATADTVSSVTIGASNVVTLNLATGIPAGATTTVTAEGLSPSTAGTAITVTAVPQYTSSTVTTTASAASAASTTLAVASTADIGIGQTVTDNTTAAHIPAGDTVTAVGASSVTLATAASVALDDSITFTGAQLNVDAAGNASTVTETTTNSVTFGSTVSGASVAPSPGLAGTSSTYTVSFKANTALTVGQYICFAEPNTSFSSSSLAALVSDTTAGTQGVASTVHDESFATSCGTGAVTADANDLAIATPVAVSAGDEVAVTVTNVSNPTSAGTVSDFAVSTQGDTVSTDAASYAVTVSSSAGVTVTPSPATPGSLATYTVSGLHASAAIAAGSTFNIEVNSTDHGTVLPNASGDYEVTDSTTASGTGGLTIVTYVSADDVLVKTNNAINSGDVLTITIMDVVNPASSGTYTLGILNNANLAAPAVTAPAFPNAAVTLPDAGIINYAGTYYLFAGGHAFGIPSLTVLAGVQAVDHATVINAATGATVPTAAAATGTLIVVYNNPTIYVVGTDGQLHGFATPAQFLGDGYDGADVITVPNLGGITVGATAGSLGTAATALATSSNGAIVNSSGTFYVFAGGKAFGIPNPAALNIVLAGDTAQPISGTVTSTNTGATIRNGTLLTVGGAVWVANNSSLFEFKAASQLQADGYGGTPSIVATNAGGLATVTVYTGS
jgi:hypothetical protein